MEEMRTAKIKTEVEITYSDIYDMVITAIEGGAYSSFGVVSGREWKKAWMAAENNECTGDCFAEVKAFDREERDSTWMLTDEILVKGLNTISEKYPHIFSNLMSGDYDVLGADAFLQCALLGDVVYG